MPDKIEKDAVVAFLYKLSTADGELIEETDDKDPMVYLHGHQNIIPGLEKGLVGMGVGDTKTVVVEPVDAYGEREDDSIQQIDRASIPAEIELEEGLVLGMQSPDGQHVQVVVTGWDDDTVSLDFNHPLAGEQLRFDVTITEVREATSEELAHGHAHSGHHHH